jgi:hypothetical protein
MKAIEHVQGENLKLLMEIFTLKMKISELYIQEGPCSSKYISLSLKLDVLMKEYFEEKLKNFIEMTKCGGLEVWKQSQTLDDLFSQDQNLKQLMD